MRDETVGRLNETITTPLLPLAPYSTLKAIYHSCEISILCVGQCKHLAARLLWGATRVQADWKPASDHSAVLAHADIANANDSSFLYT